MFTIKLKYMGIMLFGKCEPPIGLSRRVLRLIALTCLMGTVASVSTETISAETHVAQRFDLRIENGRIAGNLKTIRVRRDDEVAITWSADRRTMLHLHGYNIEIVVDFGKPQLMSFRARATGRFPIETHDGNHTVIIYLEVHPR